MGRSRGSDICHRGASAVAGLGDAPARADDRTTGLGLDITASQGTYKPGEQITLTFRVTNHGTGACQVGTIADGEVLIGQVTRDGASQAWRGSQVDYVVSYEAILATELVAVNPGDHVDVAVHALAGPDPAGTAGLRTMSVVPGGTGLVSQWGLESGGHYVVSARYKTPELPGRRICVGATNIASVAFAIGSGSKHRAFAWWWLLVAPGVLVLSSVVFFRSRRRRRRDRGGRGAARTATALALGG